MNNAKGITGKQARALRTRVNINQSEFWRAVGISQSAGSRYESERRIPQPVHLLLTLVYADEAKAHGLLSRLRTMRKAARPGRKPVRVISKTE